MVNIVVLIEYFHGTKHQRSVEYDEMGIRKKCNVAELCLLEFSEKFADN